VSMAPNKKPSNEYAQRIAQGGLRASWVLLLLPLVLMWVGALVGDNGILKLWQLKNEIRRIEEQNRHLEAKNARREKEIYLLKTNPGYIEALARKELRYLRKGEKLYWFEKEAEELSEETP